MIVTEFVPRRRFADVASDPDEVRDRCGEILFRFYVNGPFRHRLLNGDPHPGNSLFLADGRVAFLDFGFFKRQSAEQVEMPARDPAGGLRAGRRPAVRDLARTGRDRRRPRAGRSR